MVKTVLVADDDKEILEIISFVLIRHGFVVDGVSNGLQLHHHLALHLPDLIILDVIMPGEDGYRLCSSLRNDPLTCHIPVMIITAHSEDIYQRMSLDLGAAHHLTKPFHPLELAQKVHTILSFEA